MPTIGDPFIPFTTGFDPGRRVPFFALDNPYPPGYERDEYDWWVKNTGQPSKLFFNGVYQSQEEGTSDLRMFLVWSRQRNAKEIKVGIVDFNNIHGKIAEELVKKIAPGVQVDITGFLRESSASIAAGIRSFAETGRRVILVSYGYEYSTEMEDACRYASSQGCLIIVSVPNAAVSLDDVPDFPASFGGVIPGVIPITHTDRSGNLYPVAAWGNYVIGAPGRAILAQGVYSSGTSLSAAIATGITALLCAKAPFLSNSAIESRLRSTAIPIGKGVSLINPSVALDFYPP